MPRYFLEVAYKGTNYSGFQVQENAVTVQSEMQKAFALIQRSPVQLTGSSRTDAGVHALQNYFHFDFDESLHSHLLYKMNAVLPQDIVIKQLHRMPDHAHSRFDATGREYEYRVYKTKNPFLRDVAFYYPYKIDIDRLRQTAAIVLLQKNFFAFAKTNTQVKNFNCTIQKSEWYFDGEMLVYNVQANRFLRGMVRLLTASMLAAARGRLTLEQFQRLFDENVKCGYSVPAEGLFLKRVIYPDNYFS